MKQIVKQPNLLIVERVICLLFGATTRVKYTHLFTITRYKFLTTWFL